MLLLLILFVGVRIVASVVGVLLTSQRRCEKHPTIAMVTVAAPMTMAMRPRSRLRGIVMPRSYKGERETRIPPFFLHLDRKSVV